MRHAMRLVWVAVLGTACGGGGNSAQDAAVDVGSPDAPATSLQLTSFVPTPTTIQPGVPTAITWNWTFLVDPPIPTPTCTIDNGVGMVTRGQMTMVTLSQTTTYRLTCTNSVGMTARDTVVSIPAAAPVIASFTANPSTIPSATATNVTWTWTFTGTPSPLPTCTIEHGVGTPTSGTATSVTQTGSRTYQLRCTNGIGTPAVAVATVNVNECTAGTHDCDANATCLDTPNGFTCQCNASFTGNGDTCGAQAACGATQSLCDTNATCQGGAYCQCKPGYVGTGTAGNCQRNLLAFTTAATGPGALSSTTWGADAGVNVGLAAADAICNAKAATAGLPGTYVAWMSDATNDAYCRVQGLGGKKANGCGGGTLPGAGPWVRADTNRSPFAPTIDKLLAPSHALFFPASFTETGTELGIAERVWSATDANGVFAGGSCQNWTDGTAGALGSYGDAHGGGGGSWTDSSATDVSCSSLYHLRCMERAGGPALPGRHPVAKKAFLTSVSGNGMLSSWPNANGATGIAAADAICQARARFGGFANPQNFKAWMSASSSVSSRIFASTSPFAYARPDGIVIATSESDVLDGRLAAAWNQTEASTYIAGNADTGSVWTGSYYNSSFGYGSTYSSAYCSIWTSGVASGAIGRHDLIDQRWAQGSLITTPLTSTCDQTLRMYCIED